MSIDTLGRVIVGSGHFVERAQGVIAQVSNVGVGGGHYHHLSNAVQQVQQLAYDADQTAGRWIRTVEYESRGGAADANDRADNLRENNLEQLEKLGSAGLDIIEAYGWATSGDLQSAWEKLVDAAIKTGEVFVEGVTNNPPTR
jgi:hypothetical protein